MARVYPLSRPAMRLVFTGMLLLLSQTEVTHAQRSARRSLSSQVIVGLQPGADVNAVLQGTEIDDCDAIPGTTIHLLQLPRGLRPEQKAGAISRLRGDQNVRFVEPNAPTGAPEAASCNMVAGPGAQPCTEAVISGQPTTQEFYDQSLITRLNVPAAQQLLTGFPSLVAVIDTGIDPTHPLFQGHLWSLGHDFVLDRPIALDRANGRDDDRDGLVDEGYGHGTHVAGIIVLVNPEARILPLRVLDSDGNGTAFDVAAAIYEAAAEGADVINLSLSMTQPSLAVTEALQLANDLGINVFAAAGNSGGPVLYPARQPEVVGVGAVDELDRKADFSAFGPEVSVCAPGVGIFSAYPGERFAWWSGTSMACAVASGTASLTASVGADDPSVAPSEAVISSSVSIDALNPAFTGLLGNGRVDAYGAALTVLGDSGDGTGD